MYFYTIVRDQDESVSSFARRVWATLNPDYTDEGYDALQNKPSVARIIVPEGYESPYRFGKRLREMVGDHDAPIFSATRRLDVKGWVHTRYYCYRQAGRNGPSEVVVYDPAYLPVNNEES